MNVDPASACLRCWEHEDCINHPELGLACASGAVTLMVGVHEHNEIAMPAGACACGSGTWDYLQNTITPPGDGRLDWSIDGRGYGDQVGDDYGDNLGNGSGVGRAVGSPEAWAVVSHFISTLPALMVR